MGPGSAKQKGFTTEGTEVTKVAEKELKLFVCVLRAPVVDQSDFPAARRQNFSPRGNPFGGIRPA